MSLSNQLSFNLTVKLHVFVTAGRRRRRRPPEITTAWTPQHTRNVAVAAATIAWMRPLIDDWQDALREPRRGVPPHQTPGYRLAQTVARFAKCVFAERRVALSAAPLADEFQLRARDPCAGNNRSQQSQQPQQRRQQHGVRPAHATVLSPSTHAPLAPQPPPCGAPPGVAVIGGANRSYRSRVISLVTAALSGSSRDDHIESRDTTPQPRRLLSIATRSSGNQTGDEPG